MNGNSPTVFVPATVRTTTTTVAAETSTATTTTTKTAAAISLQRLSAAAAAADRFHVSAMDSPVTTTAAPSAFANGIERYTPPSCTTVLSANGHGTEAISQNWQLIEIVTSLHGQSQQQSQLQRNSSLVSFQQPMEGVEVAASTSAAQSTSSGAMLSVLSAATAAAAAEGTSTGAANAAAPIGDKDERPSLSYKDLIIEAIQSSPEKRLKLSEIYQVIRGMHPYYSRRADQWGWQNSIRHNLSLHDCFIKLPLKQTSASGVVGHFWTVVSESEEKRGSPTRRRSRANAANGTNGGGGDGKNGKLRGHHKNAAAANGGAFGPTAALNLHVAMANAGIFPVTPSVNGNGTNSMATKIKDRQSVSSDSGVMSDESQSASPLTSTATTAAAGNSGFLSGGLLNGLLVGGVGTGLDQLYQQQHQLSGAIRKSSATAVFASPAALSSLRVQTSPDAKTTLNANHLAAQPSLTHQLSPQLRQLIAPNALQLLSSAIGPSASLPPSQLSLQSTDALTSLLAGQPTLNNVTAGNGNALAQLFETTCKNRLLALQQHQSVNRFGALSTAGGTSPLLACAGLDDLLGNSPLTSELQRLQFLQFCVYQQSVIQQLLAENGTGGATAAGLLGIGATPAVTPIATPVDQLSNLLTQIQQQQQQQQISLHNVPNQQNYSQQQLLTSNLLSQLLAKWNNGPSVEHQPQHHPPPSSAPPAPLDATVMESGDLFNGTTASDGGGDVLSSHSPFAGAKPTTTSAPGSAAPQTSQQQQLIDLLIMSQQQRQQQFNTPMKREITAEEPMDFEANGAITPLTALDLKLSAQPAVVQAIGDSHQQQQLMTSLIEHYILQNGGQLPSQPPVTDAGEAVVSTTTATLACGGSPPKSPPTADPNFTANFIAAAISAASAAAATTTTTAPISATNGLSP